MDPKGFGLGAVYIKGMYRQYTDASFSMRKQPNPQHGILGPTLHAHVGDTLIIVFSVGHPRCLSLSRSHVGFIVRLGFKGFGG